MGGWGSTRWDCVATRQLVEDSYLLHVRDVVGSPLLFPAVAWDIKWRDGATVTATADGRNLLAPFVRLDYWLGGTSVSDRVALTTTRPRFGGPRWWFRCPGCGRRCGTLYRPPRAMHFRCRRCHDLAYRSQRVGARWRRLLRGLGLR